MISARPHRAPRALIGIAIAVCSCKFASAWAGEVFLAGKLEVAAENYVRATTEVANLGMVGDGFCYLSPIDNKVFSCTAVSQLKKGDVLAAKVSNAQSWSEDEVKVFGDVTYPILGCSHGAAMYPAILKAKVDMKAGGIIRSGGYVIEAKRSVKAGDRIPVLVVGGRWNPNMTSMLSVEVVHGTETPWFTAFSKDAKSGDRADAVAFWRLAYHHHDN